MTLRVSLATVLTVCTASASLAQAPPPASGQPPRTASVNGAPRVEVADMPCAIDVHDSVSIEDLTMIEVRDLLMAGKFAINGVPLDPIEKTIENGRKIVAFRTDVTVTAIKRSMAARPARP